MQKFHTKFMNDHPITAEDIDNIKEYPGSSKGPLPEHNPEHYKEWSKHNYPECLKIKTEY